MPQSRIPIALSVTALGVSVLGASPLGAQAARIVTRALYAANAGRVNGLRASKTPRPGRLLALDSHGKLPDSVLPTMTAVPGPKGDPGPAGAQGAAGSARAYALVDPTGPAFDGARTKNFTGITRPAAGIYCLTPAAGLDPSQLPASVQPERSLSTASADFAYLFATGTDCPAGAFEVKTYTLPLGGVVLDAQPASTVGFTVLVP